MEEIEEQEKQEEDPFTVVAFELRLILSVTKMDHKEAMQKLYYWQFRNMEFFTDLLLRLFQKADAGNYQRLKIVFPEIEKAYQEWFYSKDQRVLFKKYGFMK